MHLWETSNHSKIYMFNSWPETILLECKQNKTNILIQWMQVQSYSRQPKSTYIIVFRAGAWEHRAYTVDYWGHWFWDIPAHCSAEICKSRILLQPAIARICSWGLIMLWRSYKPSSLASELVLNAKASPEMWRNWRRGHHCFGERVDWPSSTAYTVMLNLVFQVQRLSSPGRLQAFFNKCYNMK